MKISSESIQVKELDLPIELNDYIAHILLDDRQIYLLSNYGILVIINRKGYRIEQSEKITNSYSVTFLVTERSYFVRDRSEYLVQINRSTLLPDLRIKVGSTPNGEEGPSMIVDDQLILFDIHVVNIFNLQTYLSYKKYLPDGLSCTHQEGDRLLLGSSNSIYFVPQHIDPFTIAKGASEVIEVFANKEDLIVITRMRIQVYDSQLVKQRELNISGPISCAELIDSDRLCFGTLQGEIGTINLSTLSLDLTQVQEQPIYAITVIGKSVYTGSSDGVVKEWNTDFRLIYSFDHPHPVLSLAADDKILVCGLANGVLVIWERNTHHNLDRKATHTSEILDLVVTSEYIFSVGTDNRVVSYDRQKQKHHRERYHDDWTVRIRGFEDRLYVVSYDGTLCILDHQLTQMIRYDIQRTFLRGIAVTPSGIYVAGVDGTITQLEHPVLEKICQVSSQIIALTSDLDSFFIMVADQNGDQIEKMQQVSKHTLKVENETRVSAQLCLGLEIEGDLLIAILGHGLMIWRRMTLQLLLEIEHHPYQEFTAYVLTPNYLYATTSHFGLHIFSMEKIRELITNQESSTRE